MIICETLINKKAIKSFSTLEDRFIIKHNNKYDYSKVLYKGNKIKIEIICPEHGPFEQTPNNHLTGHGCIKCRDKKHSDKISYNIDIFLDKANKKHKDKYDYSDVIYTTSLNKIKIICKEHGEFMQTPSKHLSGRGCTKCLSPYHKLTFENFVILANKKHLDYYTYSDNYKNSSSKTPIICPEHGEFNQIASMHLRGQGCPKCAELVKTNKNIETYRNKPTILYYIKVDNLYKIGVCVINNSYKDTESNIIKGRYSKDRKKHNIKIIKTKIYEDGSEAYLQEQLILEQFSEYRYKGYNMKSFGGHTELFEKDIGNIINNIKI